MFHAAFVVIVVVLSVVAGRESTLRRAYTTLFLKPMSGVFGMRVGYPLGPSRVG